MRQFINSALKKLGRLTLDQLRDIIVTAAGEIDRLETVLDSISEGVIVLAADHSIVMINKYVKRLLPANISENSKLVFWKQLRNEKVAAFLEQALLSGDRVEGWEFDNEYNDHVKRISLSVLPLVRDAQVTGSLIQAEDITEKRAREERMRRMENLASLTTVAAGVAHEIKNPLGGLSIHVQLVQKILSQSKHDKTLDKHLSIVNEEIERLNKIVVDFLFAVRPINLNLLKGDINALVSELAAFVSVELEQAGIESVLDLAEDLPLVYFDSGMMKQAILNLTKNAIHAMGEGGRLTFKTSIEDNNMLITVSDTGIGIPEDDLPKIFEPYFTTKDTGVGLGLTLVLKIIREHQGEINVVSKRGKGSEFTILLPVPQTEKRLIGAPNEI